MISSRRIAAALGLAAGRRPVAVVLPAVEA
jgi:hypothetical protein